MIRLAVDALNLRADARGMGRLVRGILRDLAPHAALTLLVRDRRDARALAPGLPAEVAFASLRTARRRDRYDAVWFPWNALRFRAAAPSVVTVCDDFAFRFPARGFIARRREQGPIRRALREAGALTTISSWSREALAQRFDLAPERFTILPLAPDPAFFPAPEPAPPETPFVLVVAGSEPRKNLRGFAEIFDAAFPARDANLVVVGNPDARDRRRLRKLDAIVRGADDAELRALYRTARVVAVPSLAEGFGLVAAEAQACGAAVIAADASALPEAVGDAAALVALDDRIGWIETLQRIVADDGLNASLRAAAVARWSFAPRDGAARALLAQLTRLVHDRA